MAMVRAVYWTGRWAMKCKYCGSQVVLKNEACELCDNIIYLVKRGAAPFAIVAIVNELCPRIKLTIKARK